jgi:hypothetical protein
MLLRSALFLVAAVAGVWFLFRSDVLEPSSPTQSADRMAVELVRAAERADVCTAANAVGVGLRGEYFAEALLRGPTILVRVDDVVDFDSSVQWPTDIAERPVSARWSGWIKPPLTGRYRFHADAPNMRIVLARNVVAGIGAGPEASVDLAAGRFYPIEVTVSQISEPGTRIRLEWTTPYGARFLVPKALLHLPTETVATPRP